MDTFDIVSDLGDHSVKIERARAVLQEVTDYFEDAECCISLPHYADHIMLLLHVTDSLLYEIPSKLDEAAGELSSSLKGGTAASSEPVPRPRYGIPCPSPHRRVKEGA